jgi:hypothetical protein
MSNQSLPFDLDKTKTVVEIIWLLIRIVGGVVTGIVVTVELVGVI